MENKTFKLFEKLIETSLRDVSIDEEDEDGDFTVSAPTDKNNWEKVEDKVEKALKKSGLNQTHKIVGAGMGFGMRDVVIGRKKNVTR